MSKTLCFGGTFNPIHLGHLICARAVAEAGGYDRVRLIPSALPPHKQFAPHMACPEDRLAMCRLAAEEQPDLFEVDDLELRRTGPSFTIDTVRQLKSAGMTKVYWLVGADVLPDLPTWYKPAELLAQTHLVVMSRPGWQFDWQQLPESYRQLINNVVEAPLIQISSTAIRRRVAHGKSIAYLTPVSVVKYVESHGLYRTDRPGATT